MKVILRILIKSFLVVDNYFFKLKALILLSTLLLVLDLSKSDKTNNLEDKLVWVFLSFFLSFTSSIIVTLGFLCFFGKSVENKLLSTLYFSKS